MMKPEAMALLHEAEREQVLGEAYLQALDLLLVEHERARLHAPEPNLEAEVVA